MFGFLTIAARYRTYLWYAAVSLCFLRVRPPVLEIRLPVAPHRQRRKAGTDTYVDMYATMWFNARSAAEAMAKSHPTNRYAQAHYARVRFRYKVLFGSSIRRPAL